MVKSALYIRFRNEKYGDDLLNATFYLQVLFTCRYSTLLFGVWLSGFNGRKINSITQSRPPSTEQLQPAETLR